MDTITQTKCFLNQTIKHVPKQLITLYRFGFASLSIQPIESLNGNARTTIQNRNTAESKMYRLLSNRKIPRNVPLIMKCLGLVQEDDFINVDFSDFGDGKMVLMFAKQTNLGRAVPVYFEELKYPIDEGSQNLFINEAIVRFLNLVKVPVRFVFDRGFMGQFLVDRLAEKQGICFYLRIKKGKRVELANGIERSANAVRNTDQLVSVYGHNLRLVRSDRDGENDEPWYIITNDFTKTRNGIINVYYHRFEIEELFKDAKRFFRMEWLKTKTNQSFNVVLWFVMIGFWLSWFLRRVLSGYTQFKDASKNPKKLLSVTRRWFEQLTYEFRKSCLTELLNSS